MSRLSWFALALPALQLAACGSGASRPHAAGDAGDAGDGTDAGGQRGVEQREAGAGTGGRGAGGAGDAGGSDDAGPSKDVVAPKFSGAKKVDDLGDGRIGVSWDPATDAATAEERLLYVVYRSGTSGGQDFAGSRTCGDAMADAGALERSDAPCSVVAPAGASSAIVRDAVPGHAYYYVVRAIDEAGNQDENTKEIGFTADDKTNPAFGGVRSVTPLSPTSVRVDWGAAYDLGTPDSSLSFDVYVSEGTTPDPKSDTPTFQAKPGVHSAVITDLAPSTTYSILVRARDNGKNTDENTRTLKVVTPEGIPPAFKGVRRADATGQTIRLFWQPATDNVTDPENIEYDVYQALKTHDQREPTYVSAPGASSITIPNLQPGTAYYFVVRARDAAGNRDDNNIQVQATTQTPDKRPPTFTGVQSVTSLTPTTALVTWPPAADDVSKQEDIRYSVYLKSSTELPLAAAATPIATVRGVTSMTVGGLQPGTTEFVVVRALDAAGNLQTANDVEKSGKTLDADPADTTPPVFTGAPTLTPSFDTPSKMGVSWSAATGDAPTDIRYHVCAALTEADCRGSSFAQHIVATTAFGAVSTTLSFLTPRTVYNVFVRAEDRAGNLETGDHSAVVSTATSWKLNVRPILFDKCIACHDTYDQPLAIVKVQSGFLEDDGCAAPVPANGCPLYLIDPLRPQFSMIYRKVNPLNLRTAPFTTVPNNYDGLQEPRDTSDKLSGDEDDVLRTWIEQGALGN